MVTTRLELIELLQVTFQGVSRDGGVSWSESDVIDDYGSDEERRVARESDLDAHWTEVVASPDFRGDAVRGSFCFLDPIGFRYYIAAAMVQSLIPELNHDGCSFDFNQVHGLLDGISSPKALHHPAYLLFSDADRSAIANYIAYHEAVVLAGVSMYDYDFFDALEPKSRSEYINAVAVELADSSADWPYVNQ